MSRNNKKYHIFEINVGKLNLVCIVLFVVIVLLTSFLYRGNIIEDLTEVNLMLLILVNVALMLVHELLHSLAYVIYGGDFKKIVYGAYLEKGVLYCLCKQNITRKNILNALMFPLFYIGIVTYIISILTNNYYLLILSIFNLSGCVGDIFTFLFISKLDKDIMFSEFDDTTSFGLYSNKDLSKIKSLGIKYVKTQDKVTRKELTKIKVSKTSYIILTIMLVLSILTLFL